MHTWTHAHMHTCSHAHPNMHLYLHQATWCPSTSASRRSSCSPPSVPASPPHSSSPSGGASRRNTNLKTVFVSFLLDTICFFLQEILEPFVLDLVLPKPLQHSALDRHQSRLWWHHPLQWYPCLAQEEEQTRLVYKTFIWHVWKYDTAQKLSKHGSI